MLEIQTKTIEQPFQNLKQLLKTCHNTKVQHFINATSFNFGATYITPAPDKASLSVWPEKQGFKFDQNIVTTAIEPKMIEPFPLDWPIGPSTGWSTLNKTETDMCEDLLDHIRMFLSTIIDVKG